MSLFGKLWCRLRGARFEPKRARRLFFEPMEERRLLAEMLSISKTCDASVNAGDILNCVIVITNSGDVDATNITLLDTTPPHTTFNAFNGPSNPPADVPAG